MDYFFAQIEERRRPMMSGKIIVVCMYSGRTADSGVVSTVNYVGRAFGIHSGMPIAFAKKRAPQADSIFLPADREYYADVSFQIDELVRKKFNKVAQASVDEWNIQQEDATAETLAREIKTQIKQELSLTCSVGVAPSLLGAKMATGMAKPNGFTVLDQTHERKMIEGSLLEKVPGIGPKTTEALKQMGAELVKDLKQLSSISLVETFGRKTGAWLYALANGEYVTELEGEKEQEEVSRIGTLKEKTRDPYLVLGKLEELESDAKEWLMNMKKSYKTVGIIFVTNDLKTHTKSLSFKNPKGWNENINKEKEQLVKAFLAENDHDIRRVGIRFGSFMDLGGQTTLF